MTVDPITFVHSMTSHWTQTLGNCAGRRLQAVWCQMAETFNHQIQSYGTPAGEHWQVLQPPTGTGKTQGLAVYCSMLSKTNHPGVLIVTRLISQADAVVETINRLSGAQVARAHHSQNRLPADDLVNCPVVVITHRAYERGLDAVARGEVGQSAWELFHGFRDDQRKLVVIDEALDVIEEERVDLEQVKLLRALFPQELVGQEVEAFVVLDRFTELLGRIVAQGDQAGRERMVEDHELAGLDPSALIPLRSALQGLRLDAKLGHRYDEAENRRLMRRFDGLLRSIQTLLSQWRWYRKSGRDHTLNSARLIMPEEGCGAVILDATASSNVLYHLFGSRAVIRPVPETARHYDNVTLHVAMGQRVGKGHLRDNAEQEVRRLVNNLLREGVGERRVFICSHKDVEPHVVKYAASFRELSTGHWMSVDGKNDWQDFDTAVIFGLPYRDRAWSANAYMAILGPQTDEWLNDEGRAFAGYKDIRAGLEVGHLVVSVVQAINRIRCRRVIDAEGHCESADVFLLLPGDATGAAVLKGICREMPGLRVSEWFYTGTKKKVRTSNHAEALARFCAAMPVGRMSIGKVRERLGLSQRTMKWLRARLCEPGYWLQERLREVVSRDVV